jgi:hypothetical protein
MIKKVCLINLSIQFESHQKFEAKLKDKRLVSQYSFMKFKLCLKITCFYGIDSHGCAIGLIL